MTTFDFSPLYRTSVGFDRLASLMSSATRQDQGNGYPPYNIVSTSEDHYRITMAVAGFSEDEIEITSEQSRLLVTGTRSFERRFNLADHVKAVGARLENGLLHIDLEREIPEAMKPRTIKIGKSSGRLLDSEKESGKKRVSKKDDKAA